MQATTYKLGKKGAAHTPRTGNQNNVASWAGLQAALKAGKGSATGAQIIAAIKQHNPENMGNAIGYTKYAVRNQWLVPAK